MLKGDKRSFDRFVNMYKQMVNEYPIRHVESECKYYLVIVEPRMHPNFEFVCKTMLRFTDNDWGLHVFHGSTNTTFVKNALKDIPNVVYTNTNAINLTIEEYNKLLTSTWFYEQIQTDKLLIFQTDSCLLKKGIDQFLTFDYIGAPWPHRRNQIGNGGFSLRDKNKCIKICKLYPYKNNSHEDVYFSRYMRTINANLPDFKTACSFSCELIPTNVIPLGVHQFVDNIKCSSFHETFEKHFTQ